jgi:glycerol-3-phosphate responsive antiterminator
MSLEDTARRLPSILIVSDGHHAVHAPPGFDCGVLVRDTDLATLVHRAGSDCPPEAVDIDSVAGLGSDDYAVDFVTGRLGVQIILTRRPQLAARAAAQGHVGLLHVYAYDSTGLRRSLEGHPRSDGVGSVVTPGLVILHLRDDELEQIPRPILAYGLIDDVDDARACLAVADAIVVRPGLAAKLAAEFEESVGAVDPRWSEVSIGSAK